MSRFDLVLKNIVLNPKNFVMKNQFYGRLYIVSAYAGVTDRLLEGKKTGRGGIYQKFVQGVSFENGMMELLLYLKRINQKWEKLGLDLTLANQFIEARVHQTLKLLNDLESVFSSGYMIAENIHLAAREVLASIGEVHSAYNAKLVVEAQGYQANFMDLSGFGESRLCTIDQRIQEALKEFDLENSITFVTGYCKGVEGIMREFDRGYSDVTFSKICVLLKKKLAKSIKEAILFKEFHLSCADPMIVGEKKVSPVGMTNYDVLDQLADVGMEAIHPKSSKPMEEEGFSLKVKNTFEPDHPGTLVTRNYRGKKSRVEIITGSNKLLLLEIHDPKMIGTIGFDRDLCQALYDYRVSYIFKSTNANSISHVFWERAFSLQLEKELKKKYYLVNRKPVAMVCVLGTNIAMPGVLTRASRSLSSARVNILCVGHSFRQVNIQFIIERENYQKAIKQLNREFFFS